MKFRDFSIVCLTMAMSNGLAQFNQDTFPHPYFNPGPLNDAEHPSICFAPFVWSATEHKYVAKGALCVDDPAPAGINIETRWEGADFSEFNTLSGGGHPGNEICSHFRDNLPAKHNVVEIVTFYTTDESGHRVDQLVHRWYWTVYTVGGPLAISNSHMSDPQAIIRHRSAASDDDSGSSFEYPWYCDDFDYDPFQYRNKTNFTPDDGLQPVNVYQVKTLWTQPAEIKVAYALSNPGVFLSSDPNQLQQDQSGHDIPTATRLLNSQTSMKIAANGQDYNEATFSLVCAYFYDPSPPGGLPDPFGIICTDQSELHYAYNNGDRHGHPELYKYFKTHRPSSLADKTSELATWTPPAGWDGKPYLYQLLDAGSVGMPGVWVQERYWQTPPTWFKTNDGALKIFTFTWVSMQQGSIITGLPPVNNKPGRSAADGYLNGPDYFAITNDVQRPLTVHTHEYWAATKTGARGSAHYPWRVVPGTNPVVRRYLGIFLASFDIFFPTTGGAEHQSKTRESGEGPPQ